MNGHQNIFPLFRFSPDAARKRMTSILLGAFIFFSSHNASAFFSNDRIDENFSYRSLKIEKIETKNKKKKSRIGCYLTGEILNHTNIIQDGVSITFYAYDFFGHPLWKQAVRIDRVEPFHKAGKGRSFRKKLPDCDEPVKFEFKVSGVMKESSGKSRAIPPGSSSAGSRSSRPNEVRDTEVSTRDIPDAGVAVDAVPPKFLIVLKNGKEIATDRCREQNDKVYFNQGGGEVHIGKDQVSEIRKLD